MSRLLVLKAKYFPLKSETFILSSMVGLIKEGYEVKIVVEKKFDVSHSSQPELIEKYNLLDKVLEFKRPIGKVKRYLDFFKLCLNPKLVYYFAKYSFFKRKVSLSYVPVLRFYYTIRKAEVFHVHFATYLKPLMDLIKIGFLKSKVVVTFHGFDAHFLPEKTILKQQIIDFQNHIHQVTVNSNYLKEKLLKAGFFEDNINIVPIGIDTSFFRPDQDKDFNFKTLKLITVGRLIPLKGQLYGIKAVKKLIDKGHDVNYTIVGDGDDFNKLKELVANLNLQEHVLFLGSKNQKEIKNLLSQHHVFLMTSTHDVNQTREAFGIVSLEAQAMGLPVIGFNSGGFPETVMHNETGYIIADRDIVAMSNAIKMYIDDKNLQKRMSDNAINHVKQKYNLNKMTLTYLSLYKN